MKFQWFCFTLLISFAVFSELKNIKENKMLYHTNGNVSITGLFNYLSGSECSNEVAKVLEETASAIYTVEALNNFNYLPGITIGLSIIDACQYLNHQKILPKMTEDLYFNESSINMGILASQEIYEELQISENMSSKIVKLNHIISPELLVNLTLQLLLNLQWMSLRAVISDSQDILNLSRKEISEEKIKVQDYILIKEGDLNQGLSAAGGCETTSVVVVIAAFNKISKIGVKMLNFKLIITPTDFTFDLKDLSDDTIVLLPSMESKGVLSKYIKNTSRHKNFFSHKGPTKSPLFIGTAVNIVKLLRPVKNLLDEHCGNINSYSELSCAKSVNFIKELKGNKISFETSKSTKISSDDILETLNVLKIKPSFNDEMFLYIASILNPNVSDYVSIFKIFSMQTKKFGPVPLKINDNLVRNREIFGKSEAVIKYVNQINQSDINETKEFTNALIKLSQKLPSEGNFQLEYIRNATLTEKTTKCNSDEECKNFEQYPKSFNQTTTSALGWLFYTWVCVNTALAFTGVTCTLSIMLFIFIRVFKGDDLESSLCFNVLLMISVVFMYSSSLVYHVEYLADNRLLCFFRINAPPVVCAVLFSLLLSRSLMLAFNECNYELGNHINGYLHSILCIFMISLQVSITIQNRNFGKVDRNCSGIHDQFRLIIAFSYNFILLIFLICVSPFIICSKRNSKEGLLISVSILLITIVWSAWIGFYILFSNNYKDAAVAIGLNATATVVVICILIPGTYCMTSSLPSDSTICYVPTLGKLTDLSGQSNQILHDSAVGFLNYKNCESGTSNPNFFTNRQNENNRVGTRESIVDLSSETAQSK